MTPSTRISLEGIEQPIVDWALDYGLTPAIVIARLERGDSPAHAITTPMKVGHRRQRLPVYSNLQIERPRKTPHVRGIRYTVDALSLTRRQWGELLGVSAACMADRSRRFGSLEAAVRHYTARQGPGVPVNSALSKGTGGGALYKRQPK